MTPSLESELPPHDWTQLGSEMHRWVRDLFPFCRSLTGTGLRQTLRYLGELLPLQLHEVPTGTQVLDWVIPPEWVIREAYLEDATGKRLLDFKHNSLHVLNYSVGVDKVVSREELEPHLYSLPDRPQWIPYEKSYYRPTWGFCLAQQQRDTLGSGPFRAKIDAEWVQGSLTYGEAILPGSEPGEVLISAHACHPSLANDNLSGLAVATALARILQSGKRRWTYRFLFAPGTLGAVTWLAGNLDCTSRLQHGLVLACVGDAGPCTFKQTRAGNTTLDRAARLVLKASGEPYQIRPFRPDGYDDRQYNSPGFKLPVGCWMRTPHGEFPEYHTSADNVEFVRPDALANSLQKLLKILVVLEQNRTFYATRPWGEPQLGRHGVYTLLAQSPRRTGASQAVAWVLNLADGTNDLLAMAEASGLPWEDLLEAARILELSQLLTDQPPQTPWAIG